MGGKQSRCTRSGPAKSCVQQESTASSLKACARARSMRKAMGSWFGITASAATSMVKTAASCRMRASI